MVSSEENASCFKKMATVSSNMGKLFGKESLYRQEIMSVIRKGFFNSESKMKINIFEKN